MQIQFQWVGVSLVFCIANMVSGDAVASGPGPHLQQQDLMYSVPVRNTECSKGPGPHQVLSKLEAFCLFFFF